VVLDDTHVERKKPQSHDIITNYGETILHGDDGMIVNDEE
jgi:hypothetical protein